jgi:hypothetical protein
VEPRARAEDAVRSHLVSFRWRVAKGLTKGLLGFRQPQVSAVRALQERERRFWPTARISCALLIFERPSMPRLAASRRSSVTVIAPAPRPVPFDAPRLRAAALAPSRPSALRVERESFVIVFFLRAPAWAFLTFFALPVAASP